MALEGTTDQAAEPQGVGAPRRRSRLRRNLEWGWVVTVVVFTLGRLLLARETLAQYGLNIWIFGIIDLVTAFPYALGTARVVGAIVDRNGRDISKWTLVAAGSFLAPYVYVALAGADGKFPPGVYLALGLLMVVFGANAIRSVARKVKGELQAQVAAEPGADDAVDVASVEATEVPFGSAPLTNPARS